MNDAGLDEAVRAERVEEEMIVAIPADPGDPEDFDVTVAALRHGHMARDLRLLRERMGLTVEVFAARYAIPADDYARYESGYYPPAGGGRGVPAGDRGGAGGGGAGAGGGVSGSRRSPST